MQPADFRRAMGRFVTGVTILTTVDEAGRDHAMTANTLTSVSMEPPLVLVCVEAEARFHDPIVESGVWGVSVLSHESRAAAAWLATRGRPLHGQLDLVPHHRGETGVALITGSRALLECRTYAVHQAGDHSIVVGEVVATDVPDECPEALIYQRGAFGSLA